MSDNQKCPNCGYCPACGRSDPRPIPWQPVNPWPNYGPWWGIYPPITYGDPRFTYTVSGGVVCGSGSVTSEIRTF